MTYNYTLWNGIAQSSISLKYCAPVPDCFAKKGLRMVGEYSNLYSIIAFQSSFFIPGTLQAHISASHFISVSYKIRLDGLDCFYIGVELRCMRLL